VIAEPALTFDPATHVYRYGGRVVPSVTQILGMLNDFSSVPPEKLARAADFGRNVHAAIDLDNQGALDEEALDPALLPYLNQWRRFLEETGFVVTSSEQRIYHKRLHYAGTLDVAGVWQNTSWLLDVKTGWVPKSVGPQLAAYQQALPTPPKRRLCVQLTEERYNLHECKGPTDFSIFQSCLNVFNFKARN
jgi:hypothetical protein